ncbi:inorganic polyphosphate kinase [Brevibacillus laterosporus]|nr:inorganic polyphosphate kinase [Brevibacillus laterosporus]TPG71178.1 inorganic polyphosphate kinase [Brevibacillus laterosporus]
MSYIKQEWKDRFVDPVTGDVQNGTLIVASKLIHIEDALFEAHRILDEHTVDILKFHTRISTLEDALFNNFTDNVFHENFETLEDIALTDGWYDESNKRLVV